MWWENGLLKCGCRMSVLLFRSGRGLSWPLGNLFPYPLCLPHPQPRSVSQPYLSAPGGYCWSPNGEGRRENRLISLLIVSQNLLWKDSIVYIYIYNYYYIKSFFGVSLKFCCRFFFFYYFFSAPLILSYAKFEELKKQTNKATLYTSNSSSRQPLVGYCRCFGGDFCAWLPPRCQLLSATLCSLPERLGDLCTTPWEGEAEIILRC